MCFADERYDRADKYKKLPKWIQKYLEPNLPSISTDEVRCGRLPRTLGLAVADRLAVVDRFPAALCPRPAPLR